MASSANKTKGTFKGPISYQQNKKSWSEVIAGGSHMNSSVMSASSTPQPLGELDQLTSSAASPTPVDHFMSKITRPFLTGTLVNSIVIDITSVQDNNKEFIQGLGNILPGLHPFDGLIKLRADIHSNLHPFGNLIDCGFVTGASGIYAGGGYAVLSVDKDTHKPLEHSLNWAYHPLDYSSPQDGTLLTERDHVLAFATWASMPPFCKYCHSMDHALLNCELRKKKLTCGLCHKPGHHQRGCPRRNEASTKSGKKRKVSSGQQKKEILKSSSTSSSPNQTAVPQAVTTAHAADDPRANAKVKAAGDPRATDKPPAAVNHHKTNDKTLAVVDAKAVVGATNASTLFSHHRNTRSSSGSLPEVVTPAPSFPDVCKHCNLPGHKRTSHNACLKNPKNLQQQRQKAEDEDIEFPEFSTDKATEILSDDDESGSAPMQD
ncbi:hypothetical protein BD408DRAFT_436265 [Parasitella parasitica]|nr:hypothetical protein BD408DRAFT_436265 [Parasitella parasitica]